MHHHHHHHLIKRGNGQLEGSKGCLPPAAPSNCLDVSFLNTAHYDEYGEYSYDDMCDEFYDDCDEDEDKDGHADDHLVELAFDWHTWLDCWLGQV